MPIEQRQEMARPLRIRLLAHVMAGLMALGGAGALKTASAQGVHQPAATGSRDIETAHPTSSVPRPIVEPAPSSLSPSGQPLPQARRHQPSLFVLLRDLPPEAQERVLANSARFQRLPAQRQAQIRLNLQRWSTLGPERKQIFREREAILQSLSPPQRRELKAIFPLYRRLAPERRQQVMRAFLHLRDLPAGERQTFLSSAELQELSAQEQEILGRLSQLLPWARP